MTFVRESRSYRRERMLKGVGEMPRKTSLGGYGMWRQKKKIERIKYV